MIRQIKSLGSLDAGLKRLMAAMLEQGAADALMVPLRQPDGVSVLPGLVTTGAALSQAVMISPCFSVNGARMASRLSFRPAGRRTAVWMRPCEIRAFQELVKLNQASSDELVIMGMDCPMALDRHSYLARAGELAENPDAWAKTVFPAPLSAGVELSRACSVCNAPFPGHADLCFLFYGRDPGDGLLVEAGTPKGEELLGSVSSGLGTEGRIPGDRAVVGEAVTDAAARAFEAMAKGLRPLTDTPERLATFFAACINCYNCRTVCPVCYCRECVFNTDVFTHEPFLYHQWADRKGQVMLPPDTLFYHLTRMAHMGHACVGCGQCTRACPSDIPVSDLFSGVAREIQAAFGYVPGGDEPPPMSGFETDEFREVVGIGE